MRAGYHDPRAHVVRRGRGSLLRHMRHTASSYARCTKLKRGRQEHPARTDTCRLISRIRYTLVNPGGYHMDSRCFSIAREPREIPPPMPARQNPPVKSDVEVHDDQADHRPDNVVSDPLAYLSEPPVVERRQGHSMHSKRFTRMTSRRGFVAMAAAAIAGVTAIGVPLRTEGSFYPGTSVGGLDISEATFPEGIELLKSHLADFENTAVDFVFEEQSWNASLNELGFKIDYDATLKQAYAHGRESGVIDRYTGILIATDEKSFPVIFHHDPSRTETFLDGINSQIIGAARDARLYLQDVDVKIMPNQDGRKLDMESALAETGRIVQSARRGTVTLQALPVVSQITVDDLAPEQERAQTMISSPVTLTLGSDTWTVTPDMLRSSLVLPQEGELVPSTLSVEVLSEGLQEIAQAVYRDPTNAVFGWDHGLWVLEDDVSGREVNMPELVAAIEQEAETSGRRSVRLPMNEILAAARADNADELGIVDLLGTGSSSYQYSSQARAANVRISAEHLTHTLVPPGGTYSFNDAIGPITVENGFVEGKIIRGSWIVSDIGGGACQASTTVFRAALYAGFVLPEWHAHDFRLAFYEADGSPPGLDAAIYQPNDPGDWELDLTFENPTDNWLLVECSADNEIADCRIYGTSPGWDVEVSVPYVSDPIAPEGPEEKESDKLKRGEREKVTEAAPGYDVQMVQRVMQDGEEIRTREFWSQYKPQREQWMIGPGTKRQFDDNGNPVPTETPTENPVG